MHFGHLQKKNKLLTLINYFFQLKYGLQSITNVWFPDTLVLFTESLNKGWGYFFTCLWQRTVERDWFLHIIKMKVESVRYLRTARIGRVSDRS